jgi:dTDP-4-dehydrorhamnose 3,5-epimerase
VILTETGLQGCVVVDLERREDERGFFARTFCRSEFAAAGLEPVVEQGNLSFNHRAGTLRGMHYQVAPATEAKLVRCTAGAVLDVVVDVREDSPTHLRSFAVELTADNRRALYVPPMFAHGYLTLVDGAEVSYLVSEAYTPGTERGLRHDDPALGLSWPLPVAVISAKDAAWPLLEQSR